MNNLIKTGLQFVLLLSCCMTFATCSKDNDTVTNPAQPESTIGTVDSYSHGTIATASGLGMEVIPGSVPETQNNTSAKVTFSIESPVDPPVALPVQAVGKGQIARLGPDGFTFRWPVRVVLPYPEGINPDDLSIMTYNATLAKWEVVPASFADAAKRLVGTDALELGYYTLAAVNLPSKVSGPQSEGGFRYYGEFGYYYSLTVRSVTLKYPNQAAWYPNLVGRVAGASGSGPTGGPLQPTYARLPQGMYEIWITRTKPGTPMTLPKVETYTMPATGSIDQPLRYWGMGNTEGWVTLDPPGGGDWQEGRPGNWPNPTNPMGTGEFQATLTWVNTPNHNADLDLHLYGPDNLHVSWLDETSPDGSLALDRDWQEAVGNAVENIFSLKQMPKGSYNIKLHNFSGDPTMSMAFNFRLIRFGSVRTWSGALKDGDEITITNFTVN